MYSFKRKRNLIMGSVFLSEYSQIKIIKKNGKLPSYLLDNFVWVKEGKKEMRYVYEDDGIIKEKVWLSSTL